MKPPRQEELRATLIYSLLMNERNRPSDPMRDEEARKAIDEYLTDELRTSGVVHGARVKSTVYAKRVDTYEDERSVDEKAGEVLDENLGLGLRFFNF